MARINDDLNDIAINIDHYLTKTKSQDEGSNLQMSYMLQQPNNLHRQFKNDQESENYKGLVLVNKVDNTISDINLNDTIRENQEDN